MAHFLDRIFFTALTVTTAFCITLNATGSLPLAMIAGFAAPHPLRLLMKWLKRRFDDSKFCLLRARRKRAVDTVHFWAVRRDANCRNDILALLRAAYPASAPYLCFADDAGEHSIPAYIMMTLRPVSEDAVADHLRRIREGGFARAALITTSEFSADARALSLMPDTAPIALIDGEMLSALLTKHPQAVEYRSLPRIRSPRPALTRTHALKMIPVAIFLLAMYWLFGLPMYLPAGLALTWGILLLMKKRPAPAALFK